MMKPLNIAVTGLNATDNPGPGVPIIRAIRHSEEFDGTITGLAYDPLDPGVFMKGICDHVYLTPYPSEGAETSLERLNEIHAKTPIDVLLPALDSELEAFIGMEGALMEMGIHTFLPDRAGLKLRSKANFDRLEEIGIQVPKGRSISDINSIYKLHEDFRFPVMVKGQFYDAFIAYSPMEAEHYFRQLSGKWGLPIIVQEFIMGDEYDIVAVGDGRGGLIGAVPMKKMNLTDKGKAWGGITINDPKLKTFIEDAMDKLHWRGPCELEVMKDRDDGRYYLIEVNPRFPAWCYLAVGAGQNLPWAVVKLALGETVAALPPYKVGTLFIRNSVDEIYEMKEYQEITTGGELHRA